MKFNKLEKKWLKANGYWKELKANNKTKKLRKKSRFLSPMVRCATLDTTLSWENSIQGYYYWEDVNHRMLKEIFVGLI